jgi:hypothetical protein
MCKVCNSIIAYGDKQMAHKPDPRRTKEFEPRALPGYLIFQDRLTGDWCFLRPADVPYAFGWSDETQSHSVPEFNDWWGGGRKTAKGALAAAFEHDRWTRDKLHLIARGLAA